VELGPIRSGQKDGGEPAPVRMLHMSRRPNSRVLFLHGLAGNGALTMELLSLTGWTDALGHVDFLVPDGPLSTRSRADESTYQALAQRGVYDASARQRCWGLFRLLGLGVPPDAPDWFSRFSKWGVQWKQGVMMFSMLHTLLLRNATPNHYTPIPLHPPLMNLQVRRRAGAARGGGGGRVARG